MTNILANDLPHFLKNITAQYEYPDTHRLAGSRRNPFDRTLNTLKAGLDRRYITRANIPVTNIIINQQYKITVIDVGITHILLSPETRHVQTAYVEFRGKDV